MRLINHYLLCSSSSLVNSLACFAIPYNFFYFFLLFFIILSCLATIKFKFRRYSEIYLSCLSSYSIDSFPSNIFGGANYFTVCYDEESLASGNNRLQNLYSSFCFILYFLWFFFTTWGSIATLFYYFFSYVFYFISSRALFISDFISLNIADTFYLTILFTSFDSSCSINCQMFIEVVYFYDYIVDNYQD